MAPDVEVMIVSYASADVLQVAIRSVAATIPGVRVAVREHASDPAAVDALHELAAAAQVPVRIEVDTTNPGFGAGCNALAAGSEAAWYLFLNPDAEVVAWPYTVTPPATRTIVGPTYTEATADHVGRRYRIRDEILRSWFRRRGEVPDGRGFVSGAALLIDADSFRSIGGFDEGYFLFYEDIDLCLRANEAGIATIVEPGWRVRHGRAHSTRSRFADALVWSYESGCRFHRAHGSPVGGYRLYVATDATLRSIVHLARRDAVTCRAYRALARRAIRDLVRGARDPGRPPTASAGRG